MSKIITNQLLEIYHASERLQTGQKKLMQYRTNGYQQQNQKNVKLIDDFAIDCGFTVQDMAGCKLLTKK